MNKISVKFWICFLGILGLLIAILVCIPLFGIHPPRAHSIMTSGHLKLIRLLTLTALTEDETKLDRALADRSDNTSLRDTLFSFLKEEADLEGDVIEKQFQQDDWGTPFNVDYTTNIVKSSEKSLSEGLLTKREEFRIKAIDQLNRSPIIVWSSGPNRKDERCLGDDIVWPLLDEEGVSRRFLLEQEWGAKVKH